MPNVIKYFSPLFACMPFLSLSFSSFLSLRWKWVTSAVLLFSFTFVSGLESWAVLDYIIISGIILITAYCSSQFEFLGRLLFIHFPGFFLASVSTTLTHLLSLFSYYLLTFSHSLVKMHSSKIKELLDFYTVVDWKVIK